MTFDDICTRVETDLNRPDLSSDIPTWVNFTYHDVLSKWDWSFLRATAERPTDSTTYRYALPSDFREIKTLIFDDNTSSYELDVWTNEKFDGLFPDPDSESAGSPSASTIVYGADDATGDQYAELWLNCKPDADTYTLRIRYYINYGDLSGTDIPRFPARFHQLLVYGGMELGMARLREYQAAQYWKAKKDELTATMWEDDKRMPRDLRIGQFTQQKVYPSDYHLKWWIRDVR